MTTITQRSSLTATRPVARPRGNVVVRWMTSTDHKVIGYLYLITSFAFFLAAGLMAMIMRAELARPGLDVVSNEQYNQLFTMHGTIMLFLFATPLFVGFGNVIMPLQIGSPDVAFPRLNMLSYYLFLFGGLMVMGGSSRRRVPPDFGWTAYAPLSTAEFSPNIGSDLWVMGLALSGLGTISGASTSSPRSSACARPA
jgi:cytochrome c oxidase subunit 1